MFKKAYILFLSIIVFTSCGINAKPADANLFKLSEAIMNGNFQAAVEAVNDGADVNGEAVGEKVFSEISPNDRNLISLCTVSNNADDIAVYLLKNGASPNYSEGRATLLMSEASIKNTVVCRELIACGADVNAEYGTQNVLSYLLKSGDLKGTIDIADLLYDNKFSDKAHSLLSFLKQCGNDSVLSFDSIRELAYIIKKAYTSDKNNSQIPEVIYRLSQGENEKAAELLAAGGDEVKSVLDSAVIFACAFCKPDTIRAAFENIRYFKGITLGNYSGDATLVDVAAAYNSWEAVEYLMSIGFKNADKNSLIKMSLINKNHPEVLTKALSNRKGVTLKELCAYEGVFDYACANGRTDFFKAFKNQISGIDSTTRKDLLVKAADNGFAELSCFLADNGCSDLCLEAICESNCDLDMFKKLCSYVKDINALSGGGNTALHWASAQGEKDKAEYLLGTGADVNKKDDSGNTALHSASEKGELEIIKLLIKNGADVNSAGNNGDTPLITAVKAHSYETVKLLLKNGAEKELKNNDGLTAKKIAEECQICSQINKMKF